jgi:threonyl-tRNA synthetase
VKLAIGPPIESGFYYDFDFPEPIREEDLEQIQAEIDRELAEGREWVRQEVDREQAKQLFAADPYKVELVDTADGDISIYTQGDFTDLCRGPHLQNSKPIKALKLTGLAGAYWRGDSANPQLTRIYGTAFYSQEDLDAHLERLEEGRRRDHRRLGTELDLFHLSDVSPGSPFWHPKGMVIWNVLEDLRRRMNAKHGYLEVKTPIIYDKSVWETSGHWAKFRQNMFVIPEPDRTYGIKPMNCPGHMLLFNSRLHSYRELPVRYAEAAPLHRNELAGTLHGLTRVRHITQDDAHIFVAERQIEEEMERVLAFVAELYGTFGLQPHAELSTRPDNRAGDDAQWDRAEEILERVLRTHEMEYEVGVGEGVFYGPKIDLHVTDSLGRSWQMATIQLDYHMPKQFGNTFMGEDNREHQIVVIHRAVMGAFERFIGILIEHYAGAFPFWLAPVQVRVLPVGEAHFGAATDLASRLRDAGYRAEAMEPTETIGKRIRAAELEKIPVTIVYGDRESDESLAVRERGGEQSTLSLENLLARLATL